MTDRGWKPGWVACQECGRWIIPGKVHNCRLWMGKKRTNVRRQGKK